MSITLPAGLTSSLVVGGVTQETDAFAAVCDLRADYLTNQLRFRVLQGTTSGQTFSVGGITPSYEVTIDCVTGKWTISNSALTGTLGGAALTSIQNIFKTLRNNAETFVVNQNLFPGASQVNWT